MFYTTIPLSFVHICVTVCLFLHLAFLQRSIKLLVVVVAAVAAAATAAAAAAIVIVMLSTISTDTV